MSVLGASTPSTPAPHDQLRLRGIGPRPSLRLRMEAFDHLDPDEQAAVLAMLEGAILRHQIRHVGIIQATAS